MEPQPTIRTRRIVGGVALAVLAAVGVSVVTTSPPANDDERGPNSSTTVPTADATTTLAAPVVTPDSAEPATELDSPLPLEVDDLEVRLFGEYAFALPRDAAAEPGDAIFLLERSDASTGLRPAWVYFGRVRQGGDTLVGQLDTSTEVVWRLESSEFGLAHAEGLVAGDYVLMTRHLEELGRVTVVEDGPATSFLSEDLFGPVGADEDPILRSDGLADVAFDTDRETAVAALSKRFGSPIEDAYIDGCPSWHVVRWPNGIVTFFDTDGFAEYAFLAWDHVYDPERQDENPWPVMLVDRPPFTTPEGIGLGESLYAGDVDFRGGYDAVWGASHWYRGEFTHDRWSPWGGRLSGDFTDPTSVVISIEAGRGGTPAGRVC